jgi:hypothetical protein
MKKNKTLSTAVITIVHIALCFIETNAHSTPYQRALVVSGGGVSPATVLGMIDAAKAMKWNPDVVITTCGSSIGAAIANSYRRPGEALAFAKSPTFHSVMLKTNVELRNLVWLNRKMKDYLEKPGIPDMFNETVLNIPEQIHFLPRKNFSNAGNMRFIITSTRARFNQEAIGSPNLPSFRHAYFTDSETARHIRGRRSAIKRMFPESFLENTVDVHHNVRPEDAARGGVADPFLLNPGKINHQYYFTGASDLYPIELAQSLAKEVLVTYPESLFEDFEDNIIKRSFGFSQNTRALATLHFKDVKWVDMYGLSETKLNPKPFYFFLQLRNGIPRNLSTFQADIQKQYDFGYNRVIEALKAAPGKLRNVRSHLRAPISPKLYYAFTCENAYAWKTIHKSYCTSDSEPGCNRVKERSCSPIR